MHDCFYFYSHSACTRSQRNSLKLEMHDVIYVICVLSSIWTDFEERDPRHWCACACAATVSFAEIYAIVNNDNNNNVPIFSCVICSDCECEKCIRNGKNEIKCQRGHTYLTVAAKLSTLLLECCIHASHSCMHCWLRWWRWSNTYASVRLWWIWNHSAHFDARR